MNKASLRLQQIESIVEKASSISVKNLAKMLEVSEMTIRRDLVSLDGHPHIKNIRGMLIYNNGPVSPYSIADAVDANQEKKIRIGEIAASMVQDGDVIMLDIGSTVEYVARALSPNLNATVICTSYNTLSHLVTKPNLKIHFAGGAFHHDTQLFESAEGLSFLHRTRANKLFGSAAGVHKQLGVTCVRSYEAPVKKALIESSAERILILDSSKFDAVQTSCFANISHYHKVITDQNITPDWKEYLEEKDIEVIIV